MTVENTNLPGESSEASQAADEKPGAKADTKGAAATSDDPGSDVEAAETQSDSEGDKPKKKGGGFQNRIDRLTREREEARSRAADLERQLQGRSAAVAADKSDPEPTRPKESDFKDWDKFEEAKETFIADKARWAARQEMKAETAKREEASQAEKASETRKEAMKRFEKIAMELAPKFDGLEDAVERFFSDPDMTISKPMADYIMNETDRGPELVFALDADPDEAERISKLNPLAAARELARLEAKLPKPEARKVSTAPAPTKTVKGTAESPLKKLEDMSMSEYRAWANDRDKKAGKLRQSIAR